jgi:hypothetical protein
MPRAKADNIGTASTSDKLLFHGRGTSLLGLEQSIYWIYEATAPFSANLERNRT